MADLKISQLTGATTPLAGTEVLPIVQSSSTKKVAVSDLTAGRDVATAALTSTKTSAGAVVDVATIQNANSTAGTEAALFFAPTSATGNIRGARISGINDGNNIVGLKFYTGAGATITSKLEIEGATTGNVTLNAGNLVIGTSGKGIDFSATPGTGTSELLADYEEGTWTAKLYDASSGGNASATTATGYYTKIGNQVTLTVGNFNDISTAGMTAGNFIRLGDLPFTPTYNSSGSMTVGTWNFDAGYTALIPVAIGTSARLAFWQVGDNVAEVVGIGVGALTSGTSDIGRMTITYFV